MVHFLTNLFHFGQIGKALLLNPLKVNFNKNHVPILFLFCVKYLILNTKGLWVSHCFSFLQGFTLEVGKQNILKVNNSLCSTQ